MKLLYPAVFTPWSENEGDGYTVVFPDLPGCVTEGSNMIEAIEMAADAASGWILTELEEGNNIPEASPENTIEIEKDEICNLILLDIDAYSEKYGEKAVRKNITIPAWLNTYGEENNINFSKILQDSLMKIAIRD